MIPAPVLMGRAELHACMNSDTREEERLDICQELFELHKMVRKRFPRKRDNEPRILKAPRFVN